MQRRVGSGCNPSLSHRVDAKKDGGRSQNYNTQIWLSLTVRRSLSGGTPISQIGMVGAYM